MKKQVWVVVANRSLSNIYHAENVSTLHLIKNFEHTESHLSDQDLTSDRKGQDNSRFGTAVNALEQKMDPKTKEATVFATQIAKFLSEAVETKKCDALHLIASPFFLGILRQALDPKVLKVISSEVAKDLTLLKPTKIREYLPPIL
ncbi:MAG: host attachment protein [Chlamydiia bacterium]|nr:host attachment protein [Chlamydiia bacterium]